MKYEEKIDYYATLELTKQATQQDIKQAYKRLALIYHPDKNQETEQAKIKFRCISEAYSVLNDPHKRENYDNCEVADMQGFDFESFVSSFGPFQDFLTQIISHNTFDDMLTRIKKRKSKKRLAKIRKRVKKTNTNKAPFVKVLNPTPIVIDNNEQNSLYKAMMEVIMSNGIVPNTDIESMQKYLQKMILQSDNEDDNSSWDLTSQQIQLLSFGQSNLQKKKKTEIRCRFDEEALKVDQILTHFSQKHLQESKKWQEENPELKSETENLYDDIQY